MENFECTKYCEEYLQLLEGLKKNEEERMDLISTKAKWITYQVAFTDTKKASMAKDESNTGMLMLLVLEGVTFFIITRTSPSR